MAGKAVRLDAQERRQPDGLLSPAHQSRGRTRQSGGNLTARPIIVTAVLDGESFAWANALRRAHFPPERNLLDAHLTLFHALPPDAGPELKRRFVDATRGVAPLAATASRLMDLGGGTAIRIDCPALAAVRDALAAAFHGSLTRQDAGGFRPHVTIQNKVDRAAARALQDEMGASFRPRAVTITGLAAWAYEGGPWSPLFSSRFG